MSHQYTLFVISDDQNLRQTLVLILERAGYRVLTMANPQSGVQALAQIDCDLIFLDVVLAGIESRLLLPQLRRLLPHIPIILLATQASPELAAEVWGNGATGFLTKPVDPKCILAEVHAQLIEKQILASNADPYAIAPATLTKPSKPPRKR